MVGVMCLMFDLGLLVFVACYGWWVRLLIVGGCLLVCLSSLALCFGVCCDDWLVYMVVKLLCWFGWFVVFVDGCHSSCWFVGLLW